MLQPFEEASQRLEKSALGINKLDMDRGVLEAAEALSQTMASRKAVTIWVRNRLTLSTQGNISRRGVMSLTTV